MPLPRKGEQMGLLTLAPRPDAKGYSVVEALSNDGNLVEAAANLFAALRRLDSVGLERIIVEPVPESGIGRAIMDRLRRAAARG
jgi:L-threonylcarbamoyladenylate synthase